MDICNNFCNPYFGQFVHANYVGYSFFLYLSMFLSCSTCWALSNSWATAHKYSDDYRVLVENKVYKQSQSSFLFSELLFINTLIWWWQFIACPLHMLGLLFTDKLILPYYVRLLRLVFLKFFPKWASRCFQGKITFTIFYSVIFFVWNQFFCFCFPVPFDCSLFLFYL